MENARKYRTTVQIQDDEERVEGLLVQGYGVKAIAVALKLSEDQVYIHKRKIEASWLAIKEQARAKILGRLVASQMAVQRAAWRGWELSLEDEVTETSERSNFFTADGDPQESNKDKVVTKGQSGNPSFLNVITKSDTFIARMLGLEDEERKGGGISPEFASALRTQLGITADDFQVLRQQRLEREKEKALALEVRSKQDESV